MPTLTREDGTIFTVANYRSSIGISKASIMKGEMRFLAEQHGTKCCVLPINEFSCEGIFSKEDGYPIGEVVWEQLGRPESLLYCEALTKENANQALIVVVREGRVFLDAVVEKDLLVDEFASLVAENIPMDVKVYGDVPLRQVSDDSHFAFPDELVESFDDLDSSVFESLDPSKRFKLTSANDALNRAGVLPSNPLPMLIAAVALLGVGGYYAFEYLTREEVKVVEQVVRIDPYQDYKAEMAKPYPAQQLDFMVEKMDSVYAISGWRPTSIIFVPPEMRVTVVPILAPDMSALNLWSRVNNVPVNIGTDRAELRFSLDAEPRATAKKIYPFTEVMTELVDDIYSNVSFAQVKNGEVATKGNYQSMKVDVDLSAVSPAILKVFGSITQDKPIYITRIKFAVNDSGAYTGKIEFQIVGK